MTARCHDSVATGKILESRRWFARFILAIVPVCLASCSTGKPLEVSVEATKTSLPTISGFEPSSILAGSTGQNLVIRGYEFSPSMTVSFNGIPHDVQFVSSQELDLHLSREDVAKAGSIPVTVNCPMIKGYQFVTALLLIVNPVPEISEISPAIVSAGETSTALSIYGKGFVSDSRVTFNGVSHVRTFVDTTRLDLTLNSIDLKVSGAFPITVTNPPMGGASSVSNILIENPVPMILSTAPESIEAGGNSFTLVLQGKGFLNSSFVSWNGRPVSTSYLGPDRIAAIIPAEYFSFPGTAVVRVINPGSEGGTSSTAYLPIEGRSSEGAFYVAPNGDDSAAGTITHPFLTIQRCATAAVRGQTCAVRTGTYRETVIPNSGITITSYNGESVIVDGADPVTGWSRFQGSIYRASANLGTDDTNQIFVGDQMMTEARWPNGTDLYNVNWAVAQSGTTESKIVDSNLPNLDWTGAKIHLWSGENPWSHQTGMVSGYSAGTLQINVGQTQTCPTICPTGGGRYYLFGLFDALDSEQEWFYDPKERMLYFWAPGGVDPNTIDVRAKRRQFAFDLAGRSSVTIKGLAVFASTINMDSESSDNVLDSIDARFVSHFTSLKPWTSAMGGWSIILDHVEDSGIIVDGFRNSLRNSTVSYSAGNGVALKGAESIVENNLIHHTDYMANYCSGIVIENYTNQGVTRIQHNTVHTSGRNTLLFLSVRGEDVEYNDFYRGMYLSTDGAEVYACCDQAASGTRIHHNWIHDTQTTLNGTAEQFHLSGVYIDNGSSNFEIDQNVLWNNAHESIVIHGTAGSRPNDNKVHNNSIPDSSAASAIYLDDIRDCGSAQVNDNKTLFPVVQLSTNPTCASANNNVSAAGADEMKSSVPVGCTLKACPTSLSPNSPW